MTTGRETEGSELGQKLPLKIPTHPLPRLAVTRESQLSPGPFSLLQTILGLESGAAASWEPRHQSSLFERQPGNLGLVRALKGSGGSHTLGRRGSGNPDSICHGTLSEPGFIPRLGFVPCKMESSLKRLQGWGIHPAGTLFITYCMLAVYQLQKNKPPRENGWPLYLYARLSQGHN